MAKSRKRPASAVLPESSNNNTPPLSPIVFIIDNGEKCNILRPESKKLLDDMLNPLPVSTFLKNHFRRDAVCIQRCRRDLGDDGGGSGGDELDENKGRCNGKIVSYISEKYLFDLDARQIFSETSSENVFLWLRSKLPAVTQCENHVTPTTTLNSVEISDPEVAFALHNTGSHAAYCRAPPLLEQTLVQSLLTSTGLGGGHYDPSNRSATTLGRGEVELFLSTTPTQVTDWHTDFQENFTIQISGVKKWTLQRGVVRHPIRGTTPHYCRERSVVENQVKMARLCHQSCHGATCEGGKMFRQKKETEEKARRGGSYGFDHNHNNTVGPEQTATLYPGDILYFPSGMWHKVETVEAGISMNVSLMGTSYASLVCEALQHLLLKEEGWREIVTHQQTVGAEEIEGLNGVKRLKALMNDLPKVVNDFITNGGGSQSVLPPALCFPPLPSSSLFEITSEEDQKDRSQGEEYESRDGSEGTDSQSEITYEQAGEDNFSSTDLIVTMEDFQGPNGWSCHRPPAARLVKNPLASLMFMSDVTSHLSNDVHSGCKDDLNTPICDDVKRYILNVNFAGNEACDSHIRVIFLTKSYCRLMDWYIHCETQQKDAGVIFSELSKNCPLDPSINSDLARAVPPDCLFYYGLFSWDQVKNQKIKT